MGAPTCLILGGTGTLAATAEDLARSGADVTVTCRRPELAPASFARLGIRVLDVERDDLAAIDALVADRADGFDGLVDGQCYSAAHGEGLARWSRRCGSTVMLSARAVYVDAHGRHANSEEAPQWAGPTPEDTATMAYHGEHFASRLGYGANKAEAERVLSERGERVSVLRPARIHGPSTRRVREWPLVRALCEGATTLGIAGADLTGTLTSTTSIARAAAACLSAPGARVLNVGDAPAASNLRAAQILAGALDSAAEVVPAEALPDSAPDAAAASVPAAWATGQELDLDALRGLIGPLPDVGSTLAATARWVRSLAQRAPDGSWELPAALDGS